MDDMTAFVKARLDEDERELKADPPVGLGYANLPARMRREIDAKRRRLTLMAEAHAAMDKIIADDTADRADQAMAVGRARAATVAVKTDAAVWADHHDYQPRWSA